MFFRYIANLGSYKPSSTNEAFECLSGEMCGYYSVVSFSVFGAFLGVLLEPLLGVLPSIRLIGSTKDTSRKG